MAKSPMAGELKDQQRIKRGIFAVSELEIKQTKHNKPYLSIQLADVSGAVEGVIWDCGDIPTEYQAGDAVQISGRYNAQYSNIHLDSISRYQGQVDPDDFLARSRRDTDEMLAELEGYKNLTGPYKGAVDAIFEDEFVAQRFSRWPAGVEVHQAYMGGLLEHTLAVTGDSHVVAQYRKKAGYHINIDLVTAGALLHDIGKLEELDCGLTINYTELGNAHEHPYLGAQFVKRKLDQLEEPSCITKSQEEQLLHIILSHKGRLGWGAPVEPKTTEARLVFYVDLLDSDLNRTMILSEQQRKAGIVVGPWDKYKRTRIWSPREEEE